MSEKMKTDEDEGCPTDLLIDLTEDDYVQPGINDTPCISLGSQKKTNKNVELKDDDLFEFQLSKPKCQSLMDMSPSKLESECRESAISTFANSEQGVDEALDVCPIDLLVDIPVSSKKYLQSDTLQEDALIIYESFDQDMKVIEYDSSEEETYSAKEDSDSDNKSPHASYWRTPSPQSMCHIIREASKIVDNLNNSSAHLNEDSNSSGEEYEENLLCQKLLPDFLNFDTLDLDENSDKEISVPKTESSSADTESINKSSVSIKIEQEKISYEINKTSSNSLSSNRSIGYISSKHSLTPSSSEPFISKIKNSKHVNESSIPEELQLPELQIGSFDSSEVFVSSMGENSVFIKNDLISEYKENNQELKMENVLSSKTVNSSNEELNNLSFEGKESNQELKAENVLSNKTANSSCKELNSFEKHLKETLLRQKLLPVFLNSETFKAVENLKREDLSDLDENVDQEILVPKTESSSVDKVSISKSSVSIKTKQEKISSEISKTSSHSHSSRMSIDYISEVISQAKASLARSSSESFISKIKNRKNMNKSSIPEELQTPEMQRGLFDNSKVLVSNKEAHSVFIEKNNVTSEDKENDQEIKVENTLSSKRVISSKFLQKNSLSKKEVESPTLRNVSNVKSYFPSTNKKTSISCLRSNSDSSIFKEQKLDGKQQLKISTIEASPKMPKPSISSQYGCKRESINLSGSVKKKSEEPSLLLKKKSSSSDVKPSLMQAKTPSKRYILPPSLQSASSKKSTVTPSLSRNQNSPIPKFTPQSAGGRRLSFSKSCQSSNLSNLKGLRNQKSVLTSSTVEKPSLCRSSSSNTNKQIQTQNTSFLPSQATRISSLTTTSKNRFCSKLNFPSPLSAEEDKKLARALFPRVPRK